jgi:hypothetical protein
VLLTLNQVISQITTLGAAHLQIQSTGVGDFAEWQALERAYPLLWVFHETTSIGDRELVYSIRLVCADRVITGEEGDDTAGMEQEVLSDTLLILLDFLAYFQQQHAQSYKVITSASIDPFTERFNDRVAGNSVLIQIRQPFTWDACQIPQTGATIPPSVDGLTLYDFCDPSVIARLTPSQVACLEAEYGITCVDATVTQNGNAFFTVPAGATYPLVTKLDGANSLGSFNAGTKTLSFTSNPSNLQINGAQSEIIPGNSTFNLLAKLDGVAGGVYNAGLDTLNFTTTPAILQRNAIQIKTLANASTFNLITKLDGAANNGTWDGVDTLDFTSAACSPVTFQINAVNKESITSGTTFNLITKLDGSVNSGTYDAPTDTLSFTSAACSPVALQINGTPQESIAAGATFNLIATLDGVAGGTYNAATDTLAFTSNSGWVRPSFWPTLPTISAATEGGNILLLVYENRLNRFTVQINHATITWGDGTSVNVGGSTPVTTKTYTYSTLAGTVYVDAQTGENYKFVIINIARNGANVTYVDFTASAATSPLNAPSYAVEYDLSFPNCTDFRVSFASLRDARFAKILKIWALGTLGGVCRIGNTSNLRILQLPTTFTGNLGGNFARGMGAVPVGNINYGTATNCQSLFILSNIVSHGNLTANSALLLNNYLSDSYSLETFGTVTANSCTNIEFAWYYCTALTSIGLLTLPVCTSYFAAFYNTQLTAIRFADSTACTNTTSMIGLCAALQLLHCPNLTRGVNFTGTSIGNYGMNIFASGDGILNGVGTASGVQTITITGTPFGALVNLLDVTALAIRLVLTTKGYTIAN